MHRTTPLALALLLLAAAPGCFDATPSRDPQTVAEIARLETQLQGVQARLTALEGRENTEVAGLEVRLANLERALANVKQVTIENHYHGSAGPAGQPAGAMSASGTSPAPPVAVTEERVEVTTDPGAQPEAPPEAAPEETPAPSEAAPEEETAAPEPAGPPAPEEAVAAVAERPQSLKQRDGFEAWNALLPRKEGEQPRRGGRIRVRLGAQPDILNGDLDNSAVTGYILDYVYEALGDRSADTLEYEPALAESWQIEDMLFEITGAEPIEGVEFAADRQKWVKNANEDDEQTWWPWEIRATDDGHELLTLVEHMGTTTEAGDAWTVTHGGESQSFPAAKVAGVNRGTVFTFTLRQGVKFHDGEPLTADDVVFSLGVIKCPFVDAPSIRAYYEDVRPAEKLDGRTVRIVYEKQYFQAVEIAAGFTIYPKHLLDPEDLLATDPERFGEQYNKNEWHRKPVGTGPYKFVDWKQTDSVTLQRIDDYWNPAQAGYLDTIVWKFIPEGQTALASLRAGDVDFMPSMTPEQFFKETDTPDFRQRFVKPVFYIGNFGYVGWNMRRPPFDDARVREAMACGAVDVQQFIDSVLYGAGVRVGGSQYIYGPMYDRSMPLIPFDRDRARKLLREAGWFDRDGDGVIENADRMPFAFELLLPQGSSTGRALAAIMEENLKALGIEMSVRELEWAVFIENLNNRKFDACRLGWVQGLESDPFQVWHSSNSENRGSNHVGFVNAEADQLILEIRECLDKEQRKQLNARFQRLLYKEQPYTFLYCAPDLGAYRPQFHGVRFIQIRPGYDLREWYLVEDAE